MFGLRKRVKECEERQKHIECELDGGHRWQFTGRGTFVAQWPYHFRCFYCGVRAARRLDQLTKHWAYSHLQRSPRRKGAGNERRRTVYVIALISHFRALQL
jgi:hypothetical protein